MRHRARSQVPNSGAERHYYDMIKDWVTWLYDEHCFCPENKDKEFSAMTNITCYISSPGTEHGGVCESRKIRCVFPVLAISEMTCADFVRACLPGVS